MYKCGENVPNKKGKKTINHQKSKTNELLVQISEKIVRVTNITYGLKREGKKTKGPK